MADSVYYHLERMLPELDDLKERGLFSEAEIKEIVRRRREFEFRLERRSKVKEDYLKYIQYEMQLEKLRLLRKKAIVRELQLSKRRWQPSLCDRGSAMRIMLIYERATTRFKGDLDLWMQYIEYCKSQGIRRMQKVLTKVLRLHPTVPDFWIYASAWEFEHNANITNARTLMQRSLRVCPQSEQLWLEYFRMELVYSQRLKFNNFHPAIDTELAEIGIDGEEAEESELILHLDKGDAFEGLNVLSRERKSGMNDIQIDELTCKLAGTIYKNAVSALPFNPTFRIKFIQLLQEAEFSQAPTLQDEIFISLEKDFPLDAGCWDWQARFRYEATGRVENAIKVYESALSVISSVDVYERYSNFLKEISDVQNKNTENSSITVEECKKARALVTTQLLNLYNRAKEHHLLSLRLVEDHVMLLIRLGRHESVMELLQDACMGEFSRSSRLWVMRIMVGIQPDILGGTYASKVADIFEQSLEHIEVSECGELCALVQQLIGEHAAICNRILDKMINKLSCIKGGEASALLACSLIDWIFCRHDIKHARNVYARILALPGSSIEIYRHCISLESQIATMGCKVAPKCIRNLFESALSKYSQHVQLWLEYYSMEMKAGNLDAAGTIYWRAKKTLNDPSAFIEGHQWLQMKEGC
ncbi:hypothetical protein KP509_34G074700 [Ceratopteris richardii]|uniref:U3 small nucleolar RNA-associated protein 6 n=1 Tax=Ceratopteris richardii TaxID=49495 RepID=A0A8T2QL34_CERRI|nr:hypothetical protein KP509_34G074700 [Ceratopteris richardii]